MAGDRGEDLRVPPELSARYQAVQELGAGGMGEVWLGRQVDLDRPVAIKVLKRPDAKSVARFRREAMAVKELTHPNTVRLYDFGEAPNGNLFIIMEYLAGRDLELVLREEGPLDVWRVASVARQVLKSLIEAHGHGVVHRDIKPSNLMQCEQLGEPDLIKVLDFGVARLNATGVATLTAETVGTPMYMSPEQARGDPVDARSDLYSLGLTLLELLTDRPPVAGSSPYNLAMQHASDAPLAIPPLVAVGPLGDLVRRALTKDRDQRYASAADMLADLDELANALGAEPSPGPTPVGGTLRDTLPTPAPVADTPLTATVRESPAVGSTDPSLEGGPEGPERGPVAPARAGRMLALITVIAVVGLVLALVPWPSDEARPIGPESAEGSAPPTPEEPADTPLVADATFDFLYDAIPRRVTVFPPDWMVTRATLSVDGQELVYIDDDGIWIQPAAGGLAQRVPTELGGDAWVSLFPDGRLLVAPGTAHELGPMWEVARDGTGRRVIHESVASGLVSPDGRLIAYTTDLGLGVMAADGGHARLLQGGQLNDLTLLAWAPNSESVAIGTTYPSNRVLEVPIDGRSPRLLVAAPDLGAYLNGATVAYVGDDEVLVTFSPVPGDLGCRVCRIRGSEPDAPRECGPRLNNPIALESNVNNGRLLYEETDALYDVYVADINADHTLAAPVRVTRDWWNLTGPWLNDDSIVTITSQAGDRVGLLWSLGSREPRRLAPDQASAATEEGRLVLPVERAPDGSLIFLSSSAQQEDALAGDCRVLLPDGSSVPLSDEIVCYSVYHGIGSFASVAPFSVRCGGDRCVIRSKLGELTSYSTMQWPSGELGEPFYTEHSGLFSAWALSPDGATVAIIIRGVAEVILVPVDDPSAARRIELRPSGWAQHVEFDGSGEGLYITGMHLGENRYALVHCDWSGSCEAVWTESSAWLHTPRLSPDGRQLAIGRLGMDSDLWLLEAPDVAASVRE